MEPDWKPEVARGAGAPRRHRSHRLPGRSPDRTRSALATWAQLSISSALGGSNALIRLASLWRCSITQTRQSSQKSSTCADLQQSCRRPLPSIDISSYSNSHRQSCLRRTITRAAVRRHRRALLRSIKTSPSTINNNNNNPRSMDKTMVLQQRKADGAKSRLSIKRLNWTSRNIMTYGLRSLYV